MESMLYVYGCDRQGHRKPCRVARVNMGDVVIKDQWEIYSPDGNWDKDLTRGKVVFNGNGIMSVAFNPFLDRLVAVYSQPMSTAVMFRTAEHPEGPWSRPVEAFKAMASSSTHGWVYDAVEHPEYRMENRRVLIITYSRKTGPFSFETRWVIVEIGRI